MGFTTTGELLSANLNNISQDDAAAAAAPVRSLAHPRALLGSRNLLQALLLGHCRVSYICVPCCPRESTRDRESSKRDHPKRRENARGPSEFSTLRQKLSHIPHFTRPPCLVLRLSAFAHLYSCAKKRWT